MRNKQMLPMILGMPILQLLVLVNAATFDIKNVDFVAVDSDKSEMSRRLIEKIDASKYFTLVSLEPNYDKAKTLVDSRKAKLIVNIPQNFRRDAEKRTGTEVQFVVNSEDGAAAGIIQSYAALILRDFNREIIKELPAARISPNHKNIETIERFWYNPKLIYKLYMVPGILTVLVTVVGMFLTSMNIVREREIGTIEQLNAGPIKKSQFLLGKIIPIWIIANLELAVGLIAAKFIFDIVIIGNVFTLFSSASIYLLSIIGVGLLISTSSKTQQQALFVSWFFLVIFILMSGLFTPIESMPSWAQKITWFNPTAHYVEIMRRVILKGAGYPDIKIQTGALIAFAVVLFGLSVVRYRKTSA